MEFIALILGGPLYAQAGEKILFHHEDDAWLMNPHGTDPVNLTHSPTIAERSSRVSPDGTKLLYMEHSLRNHIWVVNIDGTNRQQLTQYGDSNESPIWSPDGSQIAFARLSDPADPDSLIGSGFKIYVMNANGSDLHILGPRPGGLSNRLVYDLSVRQPKCLHRSRC
jgi:Tol biopolymer transport system component